MRVTFLVSLSWKYLTDYFISFPENYELFVEIQRMTTFPVEPFKTTNNVDYIEYFPEKCYQLNHKKEIGC
jgi:hypothetical protein